MPYDPVFKELIKAFFREFIELFFPEIAARLDFSRVRFLDKEVFTDFPHGKLREPDILAETHALDGEPELILIHIEVQANRSRTFRYRMFEYYALLRLRMKKPVFPLVLYLTPGAGGITHETYAEELFDQAILHFRYAAIGLPDLHADDYFQNPNPLAPSLSALMKPSKRGKANQKLDAFLRVVESPTDDARKAMLAHVIESYTKLNVSEREEFDSLSSKLDSGEVKEMVTIFEVRGEARGKEIGYAQGVLEAKRSDVAKLLTARFGVAASEAAARVQRIADVAELDRLFDRGLTAQTVDEVEVPDTSAVS